jgi:hypothetical protein
MITKSKPDDHGVHPEIQFGLGWGVGVEKR